MKWLLLMIVFAGVVNASIRAHSEAAQQTARNNEQTAILVALEKMNDKHISQFVKDWASENKKPSAEDIALLKITQAKIEKNPGDAIKFTTAEKQKGIDKIESLVAGAGDVFGGVKARAGAD